MKINEQLFENVLSGKLTGKFVLRNGDTFFSAYLYRNYNRFKFTHPYIIGFGSYTPKGTFSIDNTTSNFDIIDFIPDTDMKENELTIEIPDNKIVDWEESKKQNKIVLKDKQLTYENICEKLFKHRDIFYIKSDGGIENASYSDIESCICDETNATTEHQLKCILAKNKLANVAKYLNDGWKPSLTDLGCFDAWVLYLTPYNDYIGCVKTIDFVHNSNVMFKSKELAQQAIKILGEKTVKLALEPLGI